MLDYLPDDILLQIFSYLDTKDLSNVSLVCGRFWRLANDKTLWEQIDLSSFCLSLQRLWKLMHVRFPRTLKGLRVRGYAKAYSGTPRWKTETVSPPLLTELKSRCPTIESLQLIEVYFSDKTKMEHMPPSLVSIALCGCQFSSSTNWFTCSSPPPNLRHLDLSQCPGITHRAFLAICHWNNLESLSLKDCYNVTNYSLHFLTTNLRNMKSLDLRGTNISDAALIEIGFFLQNLEKLEIGGSVGSHVSVTRTELLTDVGILGLKHNLQRLILLNMSSTSITDDSIRFIRDNNRNLKHLIINNTDVTLEAIKSFESAMPHCKIVHQLKEPNEENNLMLH